MATWITHLMIADSVLVRFPELDRRGFCVGSIAPDCNIENEDWTAYTPPREVTHFMQGTRKQASDCGAFCEAYILKRKDSIRSAEEYAFLLGYYAHLIADAAFQSMIRDEDRVKAVWTRIRENPALRIFAAGMEETWDSAKRLIPKEERMGDIDAIEAEYLADHPDSGYLTEILPLKAFPDYLDFLPRGCIVRKIGVMGGIPKEDTTSGRFIAISRAEYTAYVQDTIQRITDCFTEEHLNITRAMPRG